MDTNVRFPETNHAFLSFIFAFSLIGLSTCKSETLDVPLKEGWVPESYEGGRGLRSVETDESGALIVQAHLQPAVSGQGEIFFELETLSKVRGPVDLTGSTMTMKMEVPPELISTHSPSGAQLFVETENSDGKIARQYSPWDNLTVAGAYTVRFRPTMVGTRKGYHTDPGFDVERAVSVGIKLSLGSQSQITYQGPIKIARVTVDWPRRNQIEQEKQQMAAKGVYWEDELWRAGDARTEQAVPMPKEGPADGTFTEFSRQLGQAAELRPMRGISEIQALGRPYPVPLEVLRLNIDLPRYGDPVEARTAVAAYQLPQPIDLRATRLRTWVAVDVSLRGVLSRPNRVWIELTDVHGNVMQGPWTNASVRALAWSMVELEPNVDVPMPLGFIDGDFDLTQVSQVALSFERGRFSHLIDKKIYPPSEPFPLRGTLFATDIVIEKMNTAVQSSRLAPLPPCSASATSSSRENTFSTGINYPWIHFGWDVGRNPYGGRLTSGFATHRMRLERDFRYLREQGIHLVRFFVLSDLRTGLRYNGTLPIGLDEHVVPDLETIFSVADQHDIEVIPVILDFHVADGIEKRTLGPQLSWEEGERQELITDQLHRAAFLHTAFRELIRTLRDLNDRYRGRIYAVEVGNEFGNARRLATPANFQSLKDFVRESIALIRELAPELKVTLGTRNRADLVRFWKDLDVDVWQFHYYDDFGDDEELALDYPVSCVGVDGPVLLGEVDPSDIAGKLSVIYKNGYRGALFWSFHERDGFQVDLEAIQAWRDRNLVR